MGHTVSDGLCCLCVVCVDAGEISKTLTKHCSGFEVHVIDWDLESLSVIVLFEITVA